MILNSLSVEDTEEKMYWGRCSCANTGDYPWKLSWCEKGGYIAISTKAFKAGDLICAEVPATYTNAWHPFAEAEKNTIEEEIKQLSEGSQNVHCTHVGWRIMLFLQYNTA